MEDKPTITLDGPQFKDDAAFLASKNWMDIDISDDVLDPEEEYIAPRFTLTMRGSSFAPLGDIQFLTGQTGNGKTWAFLQLIVAILRGEFGDLQYNFTSSRIQDPTVLYIDTEQAKSSTQLFQQRVYKMMDWEPKSKHKELTILTLRETKGDDRWRKILKGIHTYRPTVVFIDGIIDVVKDFNDNQQCAELIDECLMTASHYMISIWSVLHENPVNLESAKKGNGKPIGHLGSVLMRKASDSLRSFKEKKGTNVHFYIYQGKVRNKDHDDWSYHIEDVDDLALPVWDGVVNEDGMVEPSRKLSVMDVRRWVIELESRKLFPNYQSNLNNVVKNISGLTHGSDISEFWSIAREYEFLVKDDNAKELGMRHAPLVIGPKLHTEDDPF